MNDEPQVRYLPPHVADALREALRTVPDHHARAMLVTVVEETYAAGYADCYNRAYADGVSAERDATFPADMLLSHERTELQVRVSP